jgi:asparagine synthetase B (glutamine-hydrolysing)
VAEARALGLDVRSPRAIDELALGGDRSAHSLLERAGERLARGVRLVLDVAGVAGESAALVLSGGVASSEVLRRAASQALEPARVRVALSRFGPDAPVAGAALAALGV